MKLRNWAGLGVLVASAIALPAWAAPADAGADQALTASVGGISVLDPGIARAIGPMAGGQPGSHLFIVVKSPKLAIVAIDTQGSQLGSFKDDKGKDLTVAPQEAPGTPEATGGQASQGGMMMMGGGMSGFMFPAIATNGKVAMVGVDAPAIPSPGAAQLLLKGTLKVTLAGAKDVVELKDTPLKPGPLTVKGHTLTIMEGGMGMMMGGGGGGAEQGTQVTIQATGPTADAVASIEFLDAAGKVIPAQPGMSMTVPGMKTMGYQLAQKVEKATLRIGFWKDLKTVDLPLDLAGTVGLAPGK